MHREPNMLGSGENRRDLGGPPEEPRNPAVLGIAPEAQ
jgi:hypothetical protein